MSAAPRESSDLQARREELLLRSDRLRNRMSLRMGGARGAFNAADHVAEAVQWVRQNPTIVALAGAAVLGAVAARPGAFVRLGTRAYAAWRVFQRVQPMLRGLQRYL